MVKDCELQYWEAITPDFMSEESCSEEDGVVVMNRHTPAWRSESMFIHSCVSCVHTLYITGALLLLIQICRD